jgi:hypothetical protein
MCPIGVDDCPGMTPWNMSCTGTRSDRFRTISMKVFLMIRLNEGPLSISVLATLCRPIRNLITNDKFLSDSSVSGWSSGPNDISTSDHFTLLPSSMRWVKLISCSSFFSCVYEVIDRLPSKITFISSICLLPLGSTRRCSPRWGSWGADAAGGGIFLRSRKVLHSSRSCPIMRWISHNFSALVGCLKSLFSFCSEDCLPRSPRPCSLHDRSC